MRLGRGWSVVWARPGVRPTVVAHRFTEDGAWHLVRRLRRSGTRRDEGWYEVRRRGDSRTLTEFLDDAATDEQRAHAG